MSEVPVISCKSLYKVFGLDELALARGGQSIEEMIEANTGSCVPAVRDVSLDVAKGEMLVVMGLSGSGKSTLVRCLSRLIESTAGEVMIEGQDILNMSEAELIDLRRNKMGMVFQSFGLLPHRTVLENIAFPLQMRGMKTKEYVQRARDMIELVGLDGKENNFPRELSGGQQQRVGIARSLAVEPDIWFLDEPFSALDPLIRREMQDEFLRLQSMLQKTIVFITHDFDEALRLADRIAIMKDGRVEQVGRPEEIVLNPATDYVRKFTQEVPREKILNAASIMEPQASGDTLAERPVMHDDIIYTIAEYVLGQPNAVPVVRDGTVVGVLHPKHVLEVIFPNESGVAE